WREPFGLTLIEAMACGCPVVAFKRGSSKEIVKDGKTGFVVEDVDEMVLAVSNIEKINREECRKYALANFNASKMADGYEKIYNKLLSEKLQKSQGETSEVRSTNHMSLPLKAVD
ncbi:MAG TPA: glycosyltransferase, partial [Candidatus Saccharimonadales bacterium]|nr:glycosyltransferase [Candidatus Saccharimonadales bacterium]